jgi:hypothetical protein
MQFDPLNSFSLVGGTNLALRYGHRLSVDIDMFSNLPFENEPLAEQLEQRFPSIEMGDTRNKIGLFCYINGIKVDFVQHHHFDLLEPVEVIESIRMFGLRDIAAMKIFAMLKRPRKKDHWDIAEILKYMPLEGMIDAFLQKYPNKPLLITIPKALTYTGDVEDDEDPVSLNGTTWPDIKEFIGQKIDEFLR